MATFQANTGQYQPFSQGMSNLAEVFMQRPDANAGSAQLRGAQARLAQEQAASQAGENAGIGELASYFGAGEYDTPALLSAGARSGMNPDQLAQLARTGTLFSPEMTDQDFIRYHRATGDTLGTDEAVSLAGQQDLIQGQQESELAQLIAQADADRRQAMELEELRSELGHNQYMPSLGQVQGQLAQEGGYGLSEVLQMENPQRQAQADLYRSQADAASGEGGLSPEDLNRLANLESEAETAMLNLASDMNPDWVQTSRDGSITGTSIPAEVQAAALDQVITMAQQPGETRSIRALMAEVFPQMVQETERSGWFGRTTTEQDLRVPPALRRNQPQTQQGGTVRWDQM